MRMHIYMYCKYECVYAYARVFCIQTRYDSLRFLAAFVGHSLCEIHTHTQTHTLTHIHKADTAVDGVLSLSCILWLSFLLIFLFQLRARITHIQLQLARLLARPFSLCRYIFIWVCWAFLFGFWQQQSPFYFPRTFVVQDYSIILERTSNAYSM